jgi:hypothetical protein
VRRAGAVRQALEAFVLVPFEPLVVVAVLADPVVAAGGGDAAADLLDMVEHGQLVLGALLEFSLSHQVSLESGTLTVNKPPPV